MEKMANRFFGKTSRQNWMIHKFSFLKQHFSIFEGLSLLSILVGSSFLRLYKISEYMTFLGDEGRDAIVAREILQGHLTLLGPRASAGDFFLGPIYYYMIAPFLFLTRYDPVGPAIMVALFGVGTVFLVYFVGKKFFGTNAGLFSAALYAVSPIVIAYSRSSWNPNLMPFFSLLILYLIYLAVRSKAIKLFILVGFLLGIAIQLHYLTTFLGVIVFFFVLIGEWMNEKKNLIKRTFGRFVFLFLGFMVGFSPFLAFELRHGFSNIKTIVQFIFEDNASKIYLPGHTFLSQAGDVFFRIFGRLLMKFPPPEQINIGISPLLWVWFFGTIVLAIASVIALFKTHEKLKILLLGLWLFFGVFLFGIYKKPIYDYYFGFMFPLPFLLVGNFLSVLISVKKHTKIFSFIASIIFIGILILNLSGNPFRYPPNKQKEQVKKIADFVLSKTENKPYNFALITRGNSDHVYRYFFEVQNRAPVPIQNTTIDPQRKSVTEQLLVICEISNCQPLGDPLWEVAGFGRAEIDGAWDTPFVKIYRLVHYREK